MRKQLFFFLACMVFATIANAQVACYKSANFSGEPMTISDNWISKGEQDPWNDAIHSIIVDPGWSIILYEDVDNGGQVSETIEAGKWTAPALWNKKISSIAVMKRMDKCGKPFNTTLIGNKIWMAQNLEGCTIAGCDLQKTVLDNKSPGVNFYDGKPRFAYYNNDVNDKDPATGAKLGTLFNFAALKCPVCPDGYRVPNESEWVDLLTKMGKGDAKSGALALRKRSADNPAFVYTAGRIDSYGSVQRGNFVQYWTSEGKVLTLDGNGYTIKAVPEGEKKMGLYVRCLKNGQ